MIARMVSTYSKLSLYVPDEYASHDGIVPVFFTLDTSSNVGNVSDMTVPESIHRSML